MYGTTIYNTTQQQLNFKLKLGWSPLMLCLSPELTDRHDFGSSLNKRNVDILTRSQSQISKQNLLTLTPGSKDFVDVLQIDSDSIDYVAN